MSEHHFGSEWKPAPMSVNEAAWLWYHLTTEAHDRFSFPAGMPRTGPEREACAAYARRCRRIAEAIGGGPMPRDAAHIAERWERSGRKPVDAHPIYAEVEAACFGALMGPPHVRP